MRKRRVAILVIALLLMAAVAGGGIYYRQNMLDQRALEGRVKGIEALERGDYVTALDQVGRYLQRYGQEEDVEALHAYALARKNVPLPNNKHVQQSMGFLRRVVELDPDHPEAPHDLLEAYLTAGFGQETLTLADRLLERNPEDVEALKAKSFALARLQRFEEALGNSLRIAEIAPTDVESQSLAIQLMGRLDRSEEEILKYAEDLRSDNPGNSRLQLVMSVAYEVTGDRIEAEYWAERAAESAPDDTEYLELLEPYLNALGLYEASYELLERTARESESMELERALARRQYERGDAKAVVDLTDNAPVSDQDSTLLAYRALAHHRLDQTGDVETIVTELAQRTADVEAENWAAVLRAVLLSKGLPAHDIVDVCRDALAHDEDNPIFHYLLGLAYERSGERSLAIRSMEEAVKGAPAWPEPLLKAGNLLVEIGRGKEAVGLALEGLERAPRNMGVAIAAAEILGANVAELNPEDQDRLLGLVEAIQESKPEETRILPLHAELLARNGEVDKASSLIEKALSSASAFSEETALRLARVSMRHGMGLDDRAFSAFESESGRVTPAVAYGQALAAHERGETELGRKLLEEAYESAGDAVAWKTVRAQYLDVIGAEDAASAWAELSDSAPENPALQQRVLTSRAAWNDLDLIRRSIDRLRDATGEEGLSWREAEARWLLESDGSEKSAAEASVLLSEIMQKSIARVYHHTLMATALERLGNRDGAIDNLEQAAALDPDSVGVRIELARLLQAEGNMRSASEHVDAALARESLSEAAARRIAVLLANQNDTDRAIELVLNTYPPAERETPPDMLLARLYERAGHLDKAEKVLERMLEDEETVDAVQFLANLLANQGRMEDAEAVLAKLDGLELEPGVWETIMAEYHRTYGDPDTASQYYAKAVEAAGDNSGLWRRYLGSLVRNDQTERALELLAEAAETAPEDAGLARLAGNGEMLASVMESEMGRTFILSAIETPVRLEEAMEVLTTLAQTPDSEGSELALQLRQIADRYPTYLPLKLQLARLYGRLGRHDDAARLASQAMRANPRVAAAAQLAAEAYAADGQWLQALDAATEWRKRSGSEPVSADLMIAEAAIQLDRPSDALETLQSYAQNVGENPGAFSPFVYQQARALIAGEKIEDAGALLEPRLESSDQARMAWVRLASTEIESTDVAADWLQRVTPAIPEDADEERLALAAAWFDLEQREDGGAEYGKKARAIAEELVEQEDVSARAVFTLAVMADNDEEYDVAESSYRWALELDPDMVVAKNNLAMVLVKQDTKLTEARELGEEIVKAAPQIASFHDTLGQAYAALGEFDAAIASLEEAAELEPDNREWRDQIVLLKQRRQQTTSTGAQTAKAVK